MIKLLKKYQVQLTPFEATKDWSLSNVNNDDLLLPEDTGSEVAIAQEIIDYSSGFPVDNYICDIALEQQDDDLAILEDGLKITGIFYPDIDPTNNDGTYKRSIYYQIRTMFYNMYRDPTEIWGLENIDFELSKTKRKLSDKFRLINIPRNVFGDKITPKSLNIFDNTLDNDYSITDDGNGNVFAGTNLFSHQQEIGEYKNEFDSSSASSYCDLYNHITSSIDDLLIDFTGSPYISGPYDTFEGYNTGSVPLNKGFGWSSPWNILTPGYPFFLIEAEDDFSTYIALGGSNASGSMNGGWGWLPY